MAPANGARLLAALALAAAATALLAPVSLPASGCTRYAGPHGRDAGAGSSARPFRTSARLLASLPSGGVGCLAPGVYYGRLNVTKRVTLRGSGRSLIVGGITVEPAAAGTVLERLTVHGSGTARATVFVRASNVRIVGDRISGPGYANLNSACIFLDGSRDSVVDSNRIGACTHATGGSVSAPGILVGSAYGTRLTNNVISRTAGFGIVLGPNAQHTLVSHNIVDGNTGGISIGGNTHTASSFNTIRNNILSNSSERNVIASWGTYTGKRNAVVSNCFWHEGSADSAPGVQLKGNLVADPRYANAPVSYTLASGPCAPKRPSIVAVHWRVIAPFHVAYRLRALPKRVQIVSLRLTGVQAGSHVSAACVKGCSLRWTGAARSGGAVLGAFKGHWLPVGATIDVRVTAPWVVGASSRITVTGLPHGVSVSHACLAPGASSPTACRQFR